MTWQPLDPKERRKTSVPCQVLVLLLFIVVNLAVPLIIGEIIDFDYAWYAKLIKPSFIPPAWFFGQITWIVLDILNGLSGWIVYVEGQFTGLNALVYALHAAFHFAWMPIFFAGHQLLVALLDSALQWLSLVCAIALYKRVSTWASLLLVPALMWVSVAAVFNAALWHLNQK